MTNSFIAYRLPGSDEVKYYKGKFTRKNNINELNEKGLIFCSFDRSAIYQMIQPTACEASDFCFEHCKDLGRSTTKEEYSEQFHILHEQLSRKRFEKVVLSKLKRIKHHQKDMLSIFHKINNLYTNTFNYIISSSEIGCWIGATPELLCDITEKDVKSVALAGTKLKNQEWTDKEIEEQLYVTNYIEQKMADIACINLSKVGPKNISAGSVDHLKTTICCKLKDKDNWRDVIDVLHPTPATCGTPLKSSLNFIKNTEKHQRKFYTGFIGLFNEDNKKCFVNLRCMEINQKVALIYVGGGLTAASRLENEWMETERKAKTLENVLID